MSFFLLESCNNVKSQAKLRAAGLQGGWRKDTRRRAFGKEPALLYSKQYSETGKNNTRLAGELNAWTDLTKNHQRQCYNYTTSYGRLRAQS
jgi:hypothetical protein